MHSDPHGEAAELSPRLRALMERGAMRARDAETVARTTEEAIAAGQLRLVEARERDDLGVYSHRGLRELLPDPQPGARDGAVETNLVRKGLFVVGRPSPEVAMMRLIAARDRLGEIYRVDTDGPLLTESHFQVMAYFCTLWRALSNPFATVLPLSLKAVCAEVGWALNGKNTNKVQRILQDLTVATFAGEIYDAERKEKIFVRQFGLIQEWEIGSPRERGKLADVGSVMLTDWLRRQLREDNQTFYSRELLRQLKRRPVARRLLPFLESEQFKEPGENGTLVKRWPVSRELLATLGITDRQDWQARNTLARAGESIITREREIVDDEASCRWMRISIEQERGRWWLVAERRSA